MKKISTAAPKEAVPSRDKSFKSRSSLEQKQTKKTIITSKCVSRHHEMTFSKKPQLEPDKKEDG